eukprot:TRINITY_DN60063_c0_g1_i1.p1 TRINITY_DN60063_c0_g1~~TRINITY_DN60063_c0_g1_i1.p1  ORF type:complete len:172 (-),score=9.25 TRINITY_DN60063_c0_g1_i1:906-1421(-)
MKSANKQLQDTLMNYFLENQVGTILKGPLNQSSKRAVRLFIEKDLPSEGTKYINLLRAFEHKLREHGCQDEYLNLLLSLVQAEQRNDFQSDQWKSMTRKRILSLLLIVHWFEGEAKKFPDFFALWDYIFVDNPLPKRKPKTSKQQKHKKSHNEEEIQNGSTHDLDQYEEEY